MKSFTTFYAYYLENHQKLGNRIFHFLGIFATIWVIVYIIISGQERFFWYLPVTLIMLPLLGHLIFERKEFPELKNPIYNMGADFLFFFQLISGKEKFRTNYKNIIR